MTTPFPPADSWPAPQPKERAASRGAPPPPDPPVWQVPVLDSETGLVGGVSGAIARELGVDVRLIRLAWIALFVFGGWGALLYPIVWGSLSWDTYRHPRPNYVPVPKARSERHRLAGVACVVAGVASLSIQAGGIEPAILWPVGLTGFGLLLAWRRLAPAIPDRSTGQYPLAQAIGGLMLAALGAALLISRTVGLETAALLYAVVAVLAIAVVATSPWWWQVVQDLDTERQARARSDERAAVAAHLHDSVLQTLTLIQRNSEDPQTMLSLARRQERELRNWLDPDRASREGGSVRGRLDDMASEVEELYHIPVEVVTTSDCLVDDDIDQLLSAAREAVVNAAKHSGAEQIDVYAEVRDSAVEMFVRDRGVGFDRSQVATDRRGVSESLEGRMNRLGGTCTIITGPGDGTEVELVLPRTARQSVASTPESETS